MESRLPAFSLKKSLPRGIVFPREGFSVEDHQRLFLVHNFSNSPLLADYDQHDLHAGVQQVDQYIFAVNVIDVAIVRVGPAYRPGID